MTVTRYLRGRDFHPAPALPKPRRDLRTPGPSRRAGAAERGRQEGPRPAGAASGRAQVGPGRWVRPRGRAGSPAQPSPRLAAWAARRPPTRRHPRRRPTRGRTAGELGLLRAVRGAECARRRPGARGRPRCPSPRPGAEQREAAQAAAGPAAARRPREAAERAPEGLGLGLDGRRRSGVAPRLLTGGEESRNPGDPGRTAEMPQTDTTAILETGADPPCPPRSPHPTSTVTLPEPEAGSWVDGEWANARRKLPPFILPLLLASLTPHTSLLPIGGRGGASPTQEPDCSLASLDSEKR
ncbi:serine/arginine repetitive matrix protein 1-like [Eptesicus fuscus]|uniref:serine/arginine repetitive matrix protein 1-like n=1 Tax=Eptesicus fuscus TaxID=29078 RepID=UPI0024044635|nr:serine/arginine repetitive matrix protein 1-like [Eptesicus fuscus]